MIQHIVRTGKRKIKDIAWQCGGRPSGMLEAWKNRLHMEDVGGVLEDQSYGFLLMTADRTLFPMLRYDDGPLPKGLHILGKDEQAVVDRSCAFLCSRICGGRLRTEKDDLLSHLKQIRVSLKKQ